MPSSLFLGEVYHTPQGSSSLSVMYPTMHLKVNDLGESLTYLLVEVRIMFLNRIGLIVFGVSLKAGLYYC